MPDQHYPTISVNYIDSLIDASEQLQDRIRVGKTTGYILKGNSAIHKRTITVRELIPGEISFENATAIAIRFNFMGNLLKWLEENRAWKDGAYTEGEKYR